MGLEVALEDERGRKIDTILDPQGVLLTLMREANADATCCLRFIDPYGDTVFNRLQMEQLLLELNNLRYLAKTSAQLDLLEKIEKLARRCQQEPHLYVKIYGD